MAKVLAVSLLLATVAAVAAETPLLVGLRQRNLDQLEDVFWKVRVAAPLAQGLCRYRATERVC